jgi:hypothetical protein
MHATEIWQYLQTAPMRPDVAIERDADGAISISDGATGWAIEIEEVASPDELARFIDDAALTSEYADTAAIGARQRRLRRRLQAAETADAVRALVAFAVDRVPYYRERAAYRADSALADLPLLRKADIRRHFDALVADGVDIRGGLASGALELAASSGTTDERVQVIADMELSALPDDYESLWDVGPLRDTPRTAIFTSPACMGRMCHLGQSPYEQRLVGEHTLFLDSTRDLFALRRPLVERIAADLWRMQPDFLFVNPVYLHWLVRTARALDIALPTPALVFGCYQYVSRLQRRALEAALGAPVVSFYYATELAGARQAIECGRGHLHVRADHSVIEVLRGGAPAADGELGSLVITAHASRVFPVVRFAAGDVGRLVDADCPCAIGHWPVLELCGRAKDMLWAGADDGDGDGDAADGDGDGEPIDRWVTTREIDDALADTPGLGFYQIAQRSPARLDIDAIPLLGETVREADIVERLGDRVSANLGRAARVRTARRLEPAPSLKFPPTQCAFREPPEL